MNATVIIDDHGEIAMRTPFALKDVCKTVPGRRWRPERRVWTAPATPWTAKQILDALHGAGATIEADDAIQLLAEQADATFEVESIPDDELAVPDDYVSCMEPWTHQIRGALIIRNATAALLHWEMATGKTKAVIDAVCAQPEHVLSPTLIVCPKTVIPVWKREFEKHAGTDLARHVLALDDGTVKDRTKQAEQALKFGPPGAKNDLVVLAINYAAIWRKPFGEWAKQQDWALVVCDESHRIKAPGGKASRYMANMRDAARKRIALTGTPMPHSPLDIYAQFRWLDPGIFGTSFARFKSRYAITQPIPGQPKAAKVVGFRNQDELRDKMMRVTNQVRKRDVLDLPPQVDTTVPVHLEPATARVYEALERQMVADVRGGKVVATNALTKLLRLQQITGGFVKVEDMDAAEAEAVGTASLADEHGDGIARLGTEKADALAEILEDLPPDEAVVVFCIFHPDLDMVHRVAADAGRKSVELSGRRHDIQAVWEDGPETVAAVQTRAGSLGIDLTRAGYAVFYSLGYSLGDYQQARDRIHRSGQTADHVTYIHLVAEGTNDTKVMKALAWRQNIVDAVLESYRDETAKGGKQ